MVKTKERRPNTATLVKPTLLDTKLLGIFDMSTVSREHLIAIKNLVHTTPRCKCKTVSATKTTLCDHHQLKMVGDAPDAKIHRMYKVLNKTYRIRTNVRQRLRVLPDEPINEHRGDKPPSVVPAPCVTCGRTEQPERFHSHPSKVETKEKPREQPDQAPPPPPPRKTVQKPVAMKFRSSKTEKAAAAANNNCSPPKTQTKATAPSKEATIKSTKCSTAANGATLKIEETPQPATNKPPKGRLKLAAKWKDAFKKSVQRKRDVVVETTPAPAVETPTATKAETAEQRAQSENGYKLELWNPAPISGGRMRKVVCYLCSQEFGTATLPAHEAKCIQKYLNKAHDDDELKYKDANEQPPPSSSQDQENWKLAWEITQASLIACDYCDRKFLPARLDAHRKICQTKVNKENIKNKLNSGGDTFNVNSPQPGILCGHCGKRYGSSSIVIHREQCVKRNAAAAVVKNTTNGTAITTSSPSTENQEPTPSPRKPVAAATPPTVICYICGRNFGTKSIAFHQPQCLKKWKIENDKLPPNLQRSSPFKPDENPVSITGQPPSVSESNDLFWKTHQAQLIPCQKCARTFYPDRLEVHLKGCKGPTKNKTKSIL